MPRLPVETVRPVQGRTRFHLSGMPQRSPHSSRPWRFPPMQKLWAWVVLIGLVVGCLMAWPTSSAAQTSQQVNFRISRLETEIRTLQSQLNQLESQIGRGDRPSRVQPTSPNSDPEILNDSALASDPMFDRLATLVIETRQDVFALEERLEALEQQPE
ncbi:MAG: hypothetical protein WBA57_11590 [Elainellaceae cyanobacterium]